MTAKIYPSQRNPLTPLSGPPDYDFWRLDKRLRATEMRVVYVGIPDPDYNGQRRWWDLAGSSGGKQGLDLAPHATGFMHTPFQSLFSEGPYQIGAVYERTDFRKRELNIGVMVGNSYAPDTSFRYRMLEQRWWASWSEKEDGWLGVFTRTHGWRWLRVRLAEAPKTAFELDPAAFENNFMQWDMTIVAAKPHWAKRMETVTWVNGADTSMSPQVAVDTVMQKITGVPWVDTTIHDFLTVSAEAITDKVELEVEIYDKINSNRGKMAGLLGFPAPPGLTAPEHPLAQAMVEALLLPGSELGQGHLKIPNRGTVEQWPKFIVSTPGYAWVQDGIDGPMVALPLITGSDGQYVMVDTDPTARTLTGEKDPVDNAFLAILRNSQLLELLLNDVVSVTEPLWKRFNGKGFQRPIPPRTLATLTVRHSHPDGSITCVMPQHYRMAYG